LKPGEGLEGDGEGESGGQGSKSANDVGGTSRGRMSPVNEDEQVGES
jgi:hypothetical protein